MFEFLRKLLGIKKKEQKTPYVRQTPRSNPNYVSRNKFEKNNTHQSGDGLYPGELNSDDDLFDSPAKAVESLIEANSRMVSISDVEREAPMSCHTSTHNTTHSHNDTHGHYGHSSPSYDHTPSYQSDTSSYSSCDSHSHH